MMIGAKVTITGFEGIAFTITGYETIPDEDTIWSGYEQVTGRLTAVMVGDDKEWYVDPEDVTELSEDGYCRGCGQVGCAW
jgi:hypothetical protein